jgi:hypothetical protein
MSTVKEIEKAIRQLTPQELAELRAFLADLDYEAWDSQIEADAAAGRLDARAEESLLDFRNGHGAASSQTKSADEWIKDLREWAAQRRPVDHFVDASRESIY